MTAQGRTGNEQAPALVVGAGVAAGLLLAVLVSWRPGLVLVALSLLLGAALRLSLPRRAAGGLAVRSRGVDAAVLLVLGSGILLLTNAVPEA